MTSVINKKRDLSYVHDEAIFSAVSCQKLSTVFHFFFYEVVDIPLPNKISNEGDITVSNMRRVV